MVEVIEMINQMTWAGAFLIVGCVFGYAWIKAKTLLLIGR